MWQKHWIPWLGQKWHTASTQTYQQETRNRTSSYQRSPKSATYFAQGLGAKDYKEGFCQGPTVKKYQVQHEGPCVGDGVPPAPHTNPSVQEHSNGIHGAMVIVYRTDPGITGCRVYRSFNKEDNISSVHRKSTKPIQHCDFANKYQQRIQDWSLLALQ